jgi:hypothetical protein
MALEQSRRDLNTLWDNLREYLDFCLVVNTNRTHWENFNTVSDDDIDLYRQTINEALHPIREKYRNTDIVDDFVNLEYTLFASVRTGMRVPYPPNLVDNYYATEDLIDRVVNNTMLILDDFYDDMLEHMFVINNRARRIQKQWREAITNPEYQACKNRLQFEFETYSALLPQTRMIYPGVMFRVTIQNPIFPPSNQDPREVPVEHEVYVMCEDDSIQSVFRPELPIKWELIETRGDFFYKTKEQTKECLVWWHGKMQEIPEGSKDLPDIAYEVNSVIEVA